MSAGIPFKPRKKITKAGVAVYSSGWLRESKIRPKGTWMQVVCTWVRAVLCAYSFTASCAGKHAGDGYFVFWAPSGTLYTSVPQAEKQGFVDDDGDIVRVLEGDRRLRV